MSGLPKIKFTYTQGGSGRNLNGFDHYSSMIAYYSATSANSAYANIGNKIYTSTADAENDGVVSTYAEATAATSIQTVSTIGTDGDSVVITFTNWDASVVSLGAYTKITADSTALLVATGIVAAINALTYLSGFSATVGSSGAYTITAPKNIGIWPNTKSVVNTFSSSATLAITNNTFTGGTISPLAIFRYQINEYFRQQPGGVLYFSIKLDTSTNLVAAFNTQIQSDGISVLNAFNGQAKQVLFYNPFRTFATSTLTSLRALRTTLQNQYTDCVFGYVGGFTGALSAQANTRLLVADGVAAIIGQSLSGIAYQLSKTQQQVICQGGTWLGTTSLAAVSQSIGEVEAFPLSDGSECEIAGFYDGTNFTAVSSSLADLLHDYGYIFLRKLSNVAQTYWNAGNCAVSPSSDYAYMEDNRTIGKMVRGVYASIVVLLNRKNTVNADGTLSAASISAYKEKADLPLAAMVRDEDLSGFTAVVDPTAVVATTGIIPINIKAQQVVIGREIDITIGFVAKL
jgi:uncharacterized protein DUF2586